MNSPNLVLFFGGTSEERRVSVASAQYMAKTLAPATFWFMKEDEQIFECSDKELLSHKNPFQTDFVPKSPALYASLAEALDDPSSRNFLFLLALHGGSGEDGTVQREFESRGVAFTGSGSKASAAAFDKRVAKLKAKELGIRICPQSEIQGSQWQAAQKALESLFAEHRDLMVKPVAGGSSIGIYHLRDVGQISAVLDMLKKTPQVSYLVEPFVRGRELTVGVYDMVGKTVALPPSEVRLLSNNDFDYEGKYLGRDSEEITPAEVSEDVTAAVQKIAVTMHRGLGCEGYSRTDIILSSSGPVYLETNTLPGLTHASFIPQQLAAANLSFKDFLLQQIKIGWERNQRMQVNEVRHRVV